jgi:hypothetical protein
MPRVRRFETTDGVLMPRSRAMPPSSAAAELQPL